MQKRFSDNWETETPETTKQAAAQPKATFVEPMFTAEVEEDDTVDNVVETGLLHM